MADASDRRRKRIRRLRIRLHDRRVRIWVAVAGLVASAGLGALLLGVALTLFAPPPLRAPNVSVDDRGCEPHRIQSIESWALARIPRDLLAELTYVVTIGCIFKRDDEPKEYPLLVYNALQFLAYGTETPDMPASGRLDRVGFIAPRLEWTVREEVAVARV